MCRRSSTKAAQYRSEAAAKVEAGLN